MSREKNLRTAAINNIVTGDVLRDVQMETLEVIASALRNSYGPNGSVSEIRSIINDKDTGRTEYTKDGHNILGSIKFSKPIEYSIVDDLRNITRNTVNKVGDGTTSAVLLSYYIFKSLNAIEGYTNKEIIASLESIAKKIEEGIKKDGRDFTLDDAYNIAYTSTDGNEEIATNIKDIYNTYGNGVYIDVGTSNSDKSVIKSYEGMTVESGYFNSGFINTDESTCEIRNPKIYIFEDPVDTPEMTSLFGSIVSKNIIEPLRNIAENSNKTQMSAEVPTVIFAPKFGADIRSEIDKIIDSISKWSNSVKPKLLIVTNITREEFLYDLAKLSGAKLIKKYIDPEIQKIDVQNGLAATTVTVTSFGGTADMVVADVSSTKVINPKLMLNEDGSKTDEFNNYIANLKLELKKYEETKEELIKINMLKRRIQSLEANMVDYFVGGISYTERDSIKDMVEDAVLNCRSAAEHGVGKGANFEAAKSCFNLANESDTYSEIDKTVLGALRKAYISTVTDIYRDSFKGDEADKAESIVEEWITSDKLYNLRTQTFDDTVLTSIQADIVILDAIVRIVGLMFKTNQYILPNPSFNTYDF